MQFKINSKKFVELFIKFVPDLFVKFVKTWKFFFLFWTSESCRVTQNQPNLNKNLDCYYILVLYRDLRVRVNTSLFTAESKPKQGSDTQDFGPMYLWVAAISAPVSSSEIVFVLEITTKGPYTGKSLHMTLNCRDLFSFV